LLPDLGLARAGARQRRIDVERVGLDAVIDATWIVVENIRGLSGANTAKIAFLPRNPAVFVKKYNAGSTGWDAKFVTQRINGIFSPINEF
jgi:hypothetical protein